MALSKKELGLKVNARFTLEVISKLDPLLNNPARLQVVWLLARGGSMDYLDLMRLTGLSSGNITTHLQKLVRASYILQTKSFVENRPRTTLRLTDMGKAAYEAWGRRILYALPASLQRELLPGHQHLWTLTGKHWDPDAHNRYCYINLDKGLNLWPPVTWFSQ
jgi:DNA-binding MarR family transcriptional regulator